MPAHGRRGRGFTAGIVDAVGGSLHPCRVTGPLGTPVDAAFGLVPGPDGPTGVLEMAAAAGLRLVPSDHRDPLVTTTRGVGELFLAALDAGAVRLLVGCGDSGTNDGGAGFAQALGARLLDADAAELGAGGAALVALEKIDTGGLDPRLSGLEVEVACNPHNILCGPQGVARVFGPQKGASAEVVEVLAAGLDRWADVLERDLGVDVRSVAGGGASGGLGAGLLAFAGADLRPRFEVVTRYLDLDGALDDTDLVITAEGGLDGQTPKGKVPAEVAERAARRDIPVVALAGTIGKGVRETMGSGIAAYAGILQRPGTLGDAVTHAESRLADAAEQALRLVLVGRRLAAA